MENETEVDVPDGWRRIEYLCYPDQGSKAYIREGGTENVHIINMYDTGEYIVQHDVPDEGEFEEERWLDWPEAVEQAEEWME